MFKFRKGVPSNCSRMLFNIELIVMRKRLCYFFNKCFLLKKLGAPRGKLHIKGHMKRIIHIFLSLYGMRVVKAQNFPPERFYYMHADIPGNPVIFFFAA